MKTSYLTAAGVLLSCSSPFVSPAVAGPEPSSPTPAAVTISVETQEFNRDFGNFRTARIEYKVVFETTTLVAAPVVGTRQSPDRRDTSVGGSLEVYQNWSPRVSTRTALFVSEGKQVFAKFDAAQDATFGIAKKVTATVGARWAEYANGDKVLFISGGARKYFKGGSLAYRATFTRPNGRDGYLAHLGNLSLNDGRGRGKTQLWLSYGNSSIDRSQFEGDFNGHDFGGTIRRVQPLDRKLDLVLLAGMTSYDNPAGRVWGRTLGLGLALHLGD